MNNKDGPPYAQLSPDLNKVPPDHHHIHLMGICGTGMSSLAGMLKQEGFMITGSDQNVYPPISQLLEELSIPVLEGYRPQNLVPKPDLVIVGNVITRENPEAIELAKLKIPYLSLPQALKQFAMKDKKSIVISGTHGKTTTSVLVSWILEKAHLDPGFMVGGIPNNFSANFKLGNGPYFVIEGDEYDTAFFDKGPKFMHYAPHMTILTSIEFDHADIFRDLEHVLESFRQLIQLIPSHGILIANGDDPLILDESKMAKCPVTTYGLNEDVDWRAVDVSNQNGDTNLRILKQGKEYTELETPLYGRHNVANLLSAVALSHYLKIDSSILAEAIGDFRGVKRRQEIKGEKAGVLVIDDFAHHPTAVMKTIEAVKERYRDRRLIAVFEPRSNSSRRNIFQEKYVSSFDRADIIMIPEPPLMEKIPPAERLSSSKLIEDINKRDLKAIYCPSTDHLLNEILKQTQKGDVILCMSNGSFDNLPDRLLENL